MTEHSPGLDSDIDGRLVTVRGEIDAHSVARLARSLDGLAADDDLHLDLSGVEFIDSSGLRLLIETHQRLQAAGHRLELRSPSPQVRRLIDVSGLDSVFTVMD